MSYIGNQITSNAFIVDVFSGTGAQTVFSGLTFAPASTAAIAVFVAGSYQSPTSYSVSGTTLTFNSAPAAGTSNIQVLHLGTGATSIVPSDGSVNSTKLADGAVTGPKLGATAINANNVVDASLTGAKLAAATVTGDKLGLTSINANNVVDASLTGAKLAGTTITGDKIAVGTLTGNLLATGTITGDDLAANIIRANNIVAATITGNLIATSQITGNLIASSTITGDKIALTSVSGNVIATSTLTGNLLAANTVTGDKLGQGAISANNISTTSVPQVGSLGVGTPASGTTGEIRATNNITAYYSDKRLKKDITLISNALEKVSKITGVTFYSNEVAEKYGYDSTKPQVGVIAQEIENILPEIVVPAPFDIGKKGDGTEYSLSGENYKTVQYEKLIPLLIEAIKELNAKVDELKNSKG